jgi:penicillin amidase
MKQLIAKQITNEKSLWWDNRNQKTEKNLEVRFFRNLLKVITALEIQLGNQFLLGLGVRYMSWSMSIL